MKKNKYTNDMFIKKSILVHGEIYDYSKVEYNGINNKIIIICNKEDHGEFLQRPANHLQGQGCPKCGGTKKLSTSQFIDMAIKSHGYLYDYTKVKYIDLKTPIIIICKIHGEFNQTPRNHIHNSHGCPKCNGGVSDTLDIFIEKAKNIHGNLYNYSQVIYKGSYIKVKIICNYHGVFNQNPHTHLKGHGCPICTHTTSKCEVAWLDSLNIPTEFRNKTLKINNILFKPDAIDFKNKIIWEFYGDFWHGNPYKYNHNDINPFNKFTFGELYEKTIAKQKILEDCGYKIIHIWESEFLIKVAS